MIYSKGTITATRFSPTVTGVGTRWSKRVHVGDLFQLDSGGPAYQIAAVNSDTSIDLSVGFSTNSVSDYAYVIVSDFSRYYSVPYPNSQDIEKASILRRSITKIDKLLDGVSDRVFDLEYPQGVVLDIVSTPSIDSVYIVPVSAGLVTADSNTVTADSNLVLADGSTLTVPAGIITADSNTVTADANDVTADGLYTP